MLFGEAMNSRIPWWFTTPFLVAMRWSIKHFNKVDMQGALTNTILAMLNNVA